MTYFNKERGILKYIVNESVNPYFNLALEEHVLRTSKPGEDVLVLWRNDKTVLVGTHQNALEEINQEYVKSSGTHVVRRITGGGTVYQDLGNLNFSIITDYDNNNMTLDYKRYTLPVIKALHKLGVEAELTGRNDLTIGGQKFCGNAQSVIKGRILHHGSMLFSSDLNVLGQALNVKPEKYLSKGIKSVRSRVTNIVDHMEPKVDVIEYRNLLLKYMFENEPMDEYVLSEEDLKAINLLETEKFSSWDWTYGKSPKFNYKNSKRFNAGFMEVFLNVENGCIKECKIHGDFMSLVSCDKIESQLIGVKYDRQEVASVLSNYNLVHYLGGITLEQALECFFD